MTFFKEWQLFVKVILFITVPRTFTYNINSGWTQRARLLGNVHGVFVQAMTLTSGSSSIGKLTITERRRGEGEREGGREGEREETRIKVISQYMYDAGLCKPRPPTSRTHLQAPATYKPNCLKTTPTYKYKPRPPTRPTHLQGPAPPCSSVQPQSWKEGYGRMLRMA